MAQLILNDRVKETTTTTGTGTVNLAGAVEGFETFVVGVGNGKETFYSIFAGTEFEVGRGTVTDASPDTLSRTTVISSSNSDSLVDFSAGEKIRCGPLMINDYGCVEVNGWLVLSKQER